jgi:hypothetical protein
MVFVEGTPDLTLEVFQVRQSLVTPRHRGLVVVVPLLCLCVLRPRQVEPRQMPYELLAARRQICDIAPELPIGRRCRVPHWAGMYIDLSQ